MIKSIKDPNILNYIIVLYAFFIPLSLDLIRILAPLIIILWFVQGGIRSKIALIKKEPFFLSIGILLLILLISLLWTDIDNIKFGIKYIKRYWYLLPMFVIYTSLDKKFIPITLSAFLAGMFISELVSYSVFFEFIKLEGINHWSPSPFMQYTLYSVFLVLTTGIVLNRMLTSESIKLKIMYGIFFIATIVNLFINPGRTGQFLFMFVLIAVLIGYYKVTLKSLLLTLSLLLIIPYLAFTYSPIFKQRMIYTYKNVTNLSSETSIGVRMALNIVAKDIFLENPIIGVGVGDYLTKKNEILSQRYPNKILAKELVHYHNQYSEFAVIAGLLGLLSYIFILISLLKTKITDRRIHTVKYILVTTIALSSLTDAMFHLNQPLSLFALFAGLLLAQSRYEQFEVKHISHK